ncbi:MAG: alpha/beta hydrolase [Hydrogenophaga sp.]|nr:alpha/beta hydrolase [Hydrogenophaga sp.]
MTVSTRQRFWNRFSRWVEKPLIAAVRSQPLLRRVAAQHARLFYHRPPDLRVESDRLTHGERSVPGWWCHRGRSRLPAVLLFLHGGAYTVGGPVSHAHWAGALADASGMRAFLPEYRLAPEHPFPAALDDAETAYRALLTLLPTGHRIVLAGDSAGGGLAFALMARLQAAELPDPLAVVAFSPWLDLTLSGDSVQRHRASEMMLPLSWLQHAARLYTSRAPGGCANPLVSPLFHTYRRALPPTLMLCGAEELLSDDSVRMAQRLQAGGTRVDLRLQPDVGHIWPVHAGLTPEADAANDRVAAFLRAELARAHTPDLERPS